MRSVTLFILAIFTCARTSAADPLVIQQLDPNSINVEQSGEGNSVDIRQSSPDQTPTPGAAGARPNDYQGNILNNPLTSPLARAKEQPGQTLSIQPDDKKPDKKNANKINIHQDGTNNRATTSQKGTANDLNVEQNGANNKIDKTQTGEHNHDVVIQNGDTVEDKEDKEGDQ